MLCHVFWSQVEYKIMYFISLNIKENNWDFVMMSDPKKFNIKFLLKSINFVANT